MTIFMAIDPGMETGLTLWNYTPTGKKPAELVDRVQVTGGVHGFLDWWNGPHGGRWMASYLVVERFVPDGRATHLDEFEPIRIEGAIASLWPDEDIVWQRNSQMLPLNILKGSPYYTTGKEVGRKDANDVNSSARHALAHLITEGHVPTRELLFPDPVF